MANVVLLMSDEHNPFYSSVYGHRRLITPNMERLAGRGTVFENAYCPSPLCLPCRSAFMAGRRVHQIQVYNNCSVNLDERHRSYGAVLDEQGVHSVHIGKVHAYASPNDLGFSEMHLGTEWPRPGDTFIGRQPLTVRVGAAERASGYGPRKGAHDEDLQVVDRAIEWLERTAPALGRAWTLAVNIVAPHFPHITSRELWDLYPDGGDLPEVGMDCESARHPYAADLRKHFEAEKFTEEQVRGLRRGYLAGITFVDRQLGRLMDVLERSGFADDTVLLYSTDHGEMLGKFGMWWKCSLYEDSVRVPMIVAGPGFDRGTRTRTPVDLHDLQASIFKSTAATRPADWIGIPLQDIPRNDPNRVVFAEYHGHGTRSGGYLVRKGDWKLLWYAEAPHQLFNLIEDPRELDNRYLREAGKAAELEAELRKICDPELENRRAHDFEDGQIRSLRAM